jgi:hypothetical protein
MARKRDTLAHSRSNSFSMGSESLALTEENLWTKSPGTGASLFHRHCLVKSGDQPGDQQPTQTTSC